MSKIFESYLFPFINWSMEIAVRFELTVRELQSHVLATSLSYHMAGSAEHDSAITESKSVVLPITPTPMAAPVRLELTHHITATCRFSGPILYQLRQGTWRNGWDSNPQGLDTFARLPNESLYHLSTIPGGARGIRTPMPDTKLTHKLSRLGRYNRFGIAPSIKMNKIEGYSI